MIIRLACCFNCDVEVPDGSTYDVSVTEAKMVVDKMLSFYLPETGTDGCDIIDVEFIGAEDIT